ncbi:MAG: ABC transporter ATP-binding protein [Anaerolineae bacterium]|nr:ABC transporter ATP-binding protein [Anaerolineae bacterium]
MNVVEIRGVTKEYQHRRILNDLNLTIPANSFSVVYGEPACGKSVLMRILTGLEKPNAGQILLRGVDVTEIGPGERNIGYVPQSFALYPHFKVYDNIAYPLKLMGAKPQQIDPVVRQTAELLQITTLLPKRPDQLSGGEKQRVAIARGLVKNTEIFVMDDPLTGLDFKLREQLFDDLKRLQEALQATIVYTTSDPLEALILAEQLNILDGGRIIESAPCETLYLQPKQLRSMSLLGFPPTSLFGGALESRNGRLWCKTSLFDFPVHASGTAAAGQAVTIGIRPQHIRFGIEPGGSGSGWLTDQADILLTEDLGGELVVYLEAKGIPLVAVARHDESHLVANGKVAFGVQPESLVLFASEQGQRLGQGAS